MKQLILLFLLLALLTGTVSAANYTSTFPSTDTVIINQSTVQDPTPNSTPWTLWLISGCVGLILIVIALIKPRLYHMDYEINIILSVMAWPFFWYWTWGALTSIDRVIGMGMSSTGGTSTMITQHILYSFPVLGWIGMMADVAAVFVTVLLIGQFKLFKENEENQRSENV
jgi:hypothetical protein